MSPWLALALALVVGACNRIDWDFPGLQFFIGAVLAIGVGLGVWRGWSYLRRQHRRDDRKE